MDADPDPSTTGDHRGSAGDEAAGKDDTPAKVARDSATPDAAAGGEVGPEAGGEPAPSGHVFSFACYPAERVIILVAILVAPAAAALFLVDFKRAAGAAGLSLQEAFADAPDIQRLAAVMGLAVLALVVFAVVYLQYRASTRVVVGPTSLRFERRAFLPFGWLSRQAEVPFADIVLSQYRLRRLPFERPELILTFPSRSGPSRDRLVLPLAQAWEETAGGRRPWLARRPQPSGRWADHRLALLVERRIAQSRSKAPA
jgi:hypothetical protein